MALTFYFAPMSSSSRISWVLEELGVPYEKVQVDVRNGGGKEPGFLAINPHGKVPALTDGDTKLFESLAILFYLGEKYGVEKGLWPTDLGLRGEAMSWSTWASVELLHVIFKWISHGADTPRSLPKEKRDADLAKEQRDRWSHEMAILEGHLKIRQNILGAEFSLADLAVVGVVGLGVTFGKLPVTDFPHVSAWLTRCIARPAHARIQ